MVLQETTHHFLPSTEQSPTPSLKQVGFANNFRSFTGLSPQRPLSISAVYMSTYPIQHQRTKHIEIDLHFIRDRVVLGHIRVLHVPSSRQFADIFTKGLPSPLFLDF
jgi:hypothetical protein